MHGKRTLRSGIATEATELSKSWACELYVSICRPAQLCNDRTSLNLDELSMEALWSLFSATPFKFVDPTLTQNSKKHDLVPFQEGNALSINHRTACAYIQVCRVQ